MPLYTVNGIVLKYADYKDYDRMITYFTKEMGKLSVLFRGCRRQSSELLAASQPFVFSEAVVFGARGRYTANSANALESFYRLCEDVERFAAASYISSLADAALEDEVKNEALFSAMYYTLSFLAYGETNHVDMALCFAAKALYLSGVAPAITRCANCGRDLKQEGRVFFSLSGGAVCHSCRRDEREVTRLSMEALRRMMLVEDKNIGKVKLPEQCREELKPLLNDYCTATFERKFKSYDML